LERFGSSKYLPFLCGMENNKQTYNTITEDQLNTMVEDIISKMDLTEMNEDNYDDDEYQDTFDEMFFDLYDEKYTLWNMTARQAENFVVELHQTFSYFVEKHLAVSK
jgi:hypothetical protein